jgi:histone deacetylase 6
MGKITGIVNFVNGNLRAVKSDIYHDLTSWYKDHSLVYVDNDHACWIDPELRRRVTKRRFGNVIHSSASGLSKMMHSHAGEVQGWILDRVREEDGDTTEDEKME